MAVDPADSESPESTLFDQPQHLLVRGGNRQRQGAKIVENPPPIAQTATRKLAHNKRMDQHLTLPKNLA